MKNLRHLKRLKKFKTKLERKCLFYCRFSGDNRSAEAIVPPV